MDDYFSKLLIDFWFTIEFGKNVGRRKWLLIINRSIEWNRWKLFLKGTCEFGRTDCLIRNTKPLKMHFSIFSLWFSVQLYVLNVGWVTVRLSEWVNEITENVSGNPTFYVQGDKKFGIRFVSPSFLFRFVSFFLLRLFVSWFCLLKMANCEMRWNVEKMFI